MGRQRWWPSASRWKGRLGAELGVTVTVPRTRRGIGTAISSMAMVSRPRSQETWLGPMARWSLARARGPAPRSVMAQRPPGPYSATLTAQKAGGVGGTRAAAPRIVGREDRADEDDDDEAVAAVIAQRVDIPPGIAVLRDVEREVRSAITADAASRPEVAAIGTPAPGWTLPPARYRPGIAEREPGRRNEAMAPCVAKP